MLNDNRERHLHKRWNGLMATNVALSRVATTSWRRLRSWPTEAIWWPLSTPTAQGVRLHQVGDIRRALGPRWRDPGRYPRGGLP
jgi:hypothetical protein